MRKSCFFLLLILLLCSAGYSQVRHVKGIKSVEAGGGISKFGTMYYAGYVNYFSSKMQGKVNLFYEQGDDAGLKYNSMGLDLSGAYTLITIGESIYINMRGGITASSDKLNPAITVFDENGKESQEDFSTLKFGVFGGLEGEAFINDKFVFIIGGNQRYLLRTDFGNVRWFAYAGIRFNL